MPGWAWSASVSPDSSASSEPESTLSPVPVESSSPEPSPEASQSPSDDVPAAVCGTQESPCFVSLSPDAMALALGFATVGVVSVLLLAVIAVRLLTR